MTSLSEQLLAEAGLPTEFAVDLEPVITALRECLPERVPTPSPALAALLARPPRPLPSRSRGRLAVLGSAAALMSSLTVTGVAAAANELPETTQRFVADLSERFLPFQFPQPAEPTIAVVDDEEDGQKVAPAEQVSTESLPPTLQETAIREEVTPESTPEGPSEAAVVPNTTTTEPTDPATPTETATAAATATADAAATATAEATATATATAEATTGATGDPRVGTDPSASPTDSPSASTTTSTTTETTTGTESPTASPSPGPSGPTR